MSNDKIETYVVLKPGQNLEEIVTNDITQWVENVVKKMEIGGLTWTHIIKSLDEIYINIEGYNTPPLVRLTFDIENLDPDIAEELGKFIYEYIMKKYGFKESSEYLTYHTFARKTKRNNNVVTNKKDELLTNESNDIKKEYVINSGNSLFDILSALHENGNCNVYSIKHDSRQLVYNLSLNDNGRLKVTVNENLYQGDPYANGFNLEYLSFVKTSSKKVIDTRIALAYLLSDNTEYKQFITTQKTDTNFDPTIAENEFVSYINSMNLTFKDEDLSNWLNNHKLLAQWIKGYDTARINVLLKNTKPFDPNQKMQSYNQLIGSLMSSSIEFNRALAVSKVEWKKIQEGNNTFVR